MTERKNIDKHYKITMQFSPLNPKDYQELMRSHPDANWPIEQTFAWGEFQSQIPGRHHLGTFLIAQDGSPIAVASLLLMEMRGYSYIWINNGPVTLASNYSADELAATLRDIAQQHAPTAPLFIRFNLAKKPAKAMPAFSKSLLEKTTIVDLRQDEDVILAKMPYGTRRGMRKATKSGVEIKEIPAAEAARQFPKEFQPIMDETAARDGFHSHPANTYIAMLNKLENSARFFAAYIDGKPAAWAIDTTWNNQAIYYYGASNDAARKVMAPYLLHIEAMKKFKAEGVASYDFLGIGSPNFPGLEGVTQFKLRFGGDVIDYTPVFDLPLKPAAYKLWKAAQKARSKLKRK